MKRPLLPVGLAYIVGILVASLLPLQPMPLLALALGLSLTAVCWRQERSLLLFLALFFAGWTNLSLRQAILSPYDLRRLLSEEPALVTIRGTLSETPSFRVYEFREQECWRTMARLEVSAICLNRGSWQPAAGRLAVTTPGEFTNLFAGQSVEVSGVIGAPKLAAAPGTFDYRAYLQQLGIYYQLQASSEADWLITHSPSRPPLADRFRSWGRRALALGLPGDDESLRLEWALTLGWKTALTPDVAEPFVQAATYHIFAVDGLRMAIVFGIFFGLSRALRLPRPLAGLGLIPLIWFYVALTGWPASAIRATVMLTVVIFGWVLKRPTNLLNSLFAAAVIILVWQPQQLFQAGFQLSFFVVLCMLLLLPPWHAFFQAVTAPDPLLPPELQARWRKTFRTPLRYFGDLVLTSFAAWVGSLPLVAYYFHIVTPVSTPANVLAVPLCALVLVSNLASLLLAGWFQLAAELFNHAGWFLMECIRSSSHWFARWPRAYFYVAAPGWFGTGLYYLLLLTVATGWLFRAHFRAWKFAGLALLTCAWGWQSWQSNSITRLTILPLNGGEALFFDPPGRSRDLLIDCGKTNSVAMVTKPFLRAQGMNHLPSFLLTHGDVQHIGGAEIVAALFDPKQVCISPLRFRSPAYRKTVQDFGRTPHRLRAVSRDGEVGVWAVLHPAADERFAQADDGGLVLAATIRGTRVLLLSDLGRRGQEALLDRTASLRADIVVAGLPSASDPLCEGLLDAIRPQVILITDSEFPAQARASPKLRARLAKRNVPVIYTRSAGAATITFQPEGWRIKTMNGPSLAGSPSKR
jgi:competence protein ComEC